MENKLIADILNEIADMLEVDETGTLRFEVRAYRNAALTVSTLQEPIEEVYGKGGLAALMELPGIGKGIAGGIEEFIKSGKMRKYEKLKRKYPIDFHALMALEGMGPKRAVRLYKALGVKDVDSLKKALATHRVRSLQGFGAKSEERLLESIKLLEAGKGRLLLGDALPVAESIVSRLVESGLVEKAAIAGSARRMRETVGDLDILALSGDSLKAMDFFIGLSDVQSVIAKGPTKTTVWLKIGISCDLRVIGLESFGAAQQYFIGSKEHNIELRKLAIRNGYKLNEYGLFRGRRLIESLDEATIYSKLGLQYIPPEMREGRGEIKLAAEHRLPDLVRLEDIKGDLHTHTRDSDGLNTIEEMAAAAGVYGLEYFAATNHTKSLHIADGMDERRFAEFFRHVDGLNGRLGGKPTILKGAEVDILKDGSLDLDKGVLREMDCVVAAVHTSLNMDRDSMTGRITKALDSGLVHVLAHPTGRIINARDAYALNLDKVAEAAERNSVALEINSFPSRLDLNDTNIMLASKYKVNFAIDTDSHRTSHFQFLRYGVGTARRGWLQEGRVLNTLPLQKLMEVLAR